MANRSRSGFDESDHKVIKFLQECGLREPVGKTYMAYLKLYAPLLVKELKDHGELLLHFLQREIEGDYTLDDIGVFVDVLTAHRFMDNLTADYMQSVIIDYIQKQEIPDNKKSILLKKLKNDMMPILRRKLGDFGEKRRKHYLHEPMWVISKEGKESFLQALNNADRFIKLPAYSGETFFESWGIDELFVEKLRQGVNIKILFIHPDLASRWEHRPPAKQTIEMVKDFLKKVADEKRKFEQEGRRGFGNIEVRWINQPRFAFFTGLLTYVDRLSPGSGVARFNIHRIGLERGTAGLIITSDNKIGDTSFFKVLETYFDEAWKRAEPLSGPILWKRRILDFAFSYIGVILTVSAIVGIFFVNSTVATVLFFAYPIILRLRWQQICDEGRII